MDQRKQMRKAAAGLLLAAMLLVGACAEPAGSSAAPEPTDRTAMAPTEESSLPPTGESVRPTETEVPTESSTEAPTEPSTEAPTEPSIEAPTEPSTATPTDPPVQLTYVPGYRVRVTAASARIREAADLSCGVIGSASSGTVLDVVGVEKDFYIIERNGRRAYIHASVVEYGPFEKPVPPTAAPTSAPTAAPTSAPTAAPTTAPKPTDPPAAAGVEPGTVRPNTTLYTYDIMAADLHTIAARYPEHLTLFSAGTTEDGRELYTVKLGNPSAFRTFLIVGATHGREYMTAQLVMKLLEFYAANYDTGVCNGVPFSEIFEQNCFVIMPMVNPDGVSISQLGEAGIRRQDLLQKVRSIYESDRAKGYTTEEYARYLVRWKANANGVDINRNFSTGWGSVHDRSEPSSDFFKGYSPGSEKETQALMNLVNSLGRLQAVISYHSYGDLIYWQYGQSEPLWSANRELASHIQNHAGHALAGKSNEAGFTNWCIREKGIRAVVVETGRVPTPLPLSEFKDLWPKHQYLWTKLALVVSTM